MRLAKSYSGYEFDETKAYEKSGKLYVSATCKCDRCTKGVYVTRVENGQPVPHPAYGGVCLKCGSSGFIKKECRLYTDKEFEAMEKKNTAAAEKREVERETKMKAEYAAKRAEWLQKNSFNAEGTTFIYFPNDSYDVKNELKEVGFRFSSELLWHCAIIPEGYKDKVVEVNIDMVAEINAWGTGYYKAGCRNTVEEIVKAARPVEENSSEWIGNEKDKIVDLPVVLVSVHGFETRYGYSQVVKFLNGDNIIIWFTAVDIKFEPGDNILLSGTIKKLDEYNGIPQTIVTRCRIKEV